MDQKIITRTACRLCGSDKLEEISTLGNLYISTFVNEREEGIKAPLDMVLCVNCSLLQLRHTAPMELMYSRFYWYRSGVTDTMRKALRNLTESIEALVSLKPGDVVFDIGANDGTMLTTFTTKGLRKIGCEPADNLIDQLKVNADLVIHGFWNCEAYESLAKAHGFGKAKVVTAIGMFYDMEDPNQFVADVSKVLADDGVFVAQLMCLRPMLEKNDVGNICHEHLEFYSLESLRYLFENNGLEMFKLEENNVNGGSYRIYCRHFKNSGIEFDERYTKKDYQDFFRRVEENKNQCTAFIKQEVDRGKSIYVYGASTKGNTILQYYGLDHTWIKAAAERSPEKWGKFTVGTQIPIISEEQARKEQPDYFLVLPWAFFDEFYEREAEWRGRGGKFIVPSPEFRVV
ncbi:MAG: class I SAM-dependent methyltransferase [Nitrospinota bacterium]|nr:class I SAM-dependent methyltransferase [Nitrospinota bacterium]